MNSAERIFCETRQAVFETKTPDYFEDWIDLYYYLAAETSNTSGMHWKSHGYQRNICFVMADLDTPEVNIIKGTQLGLTHTAVALAIYEVCERGRSVGNYLPIEKSAMAFSDMLINAIKNMPIAIEQLKVEPDKKDSDNTNQKRAFRKGTIRSLAANSPSNYDQVPFATVMQDEYARQTARVKSSKDEEGETPYEAVKSRMDAADFRKHIAYSSPEEAGTCAINKLYNDSQVKLEEHIPCPWPDCGQYIPLEWGDAKGSHGMRWDRVNDEHGERDNLATAETAHYLCRCCHQKITFKQMIDLDDEFGELRNDDIRLSVADRCYYTIATGEVFPKPFSVGIRQNSMFSRTKHWKLAVKQFLDATDGMKTGDSSKMITFVKKYLAIAYQAIESVAYVKHEFLMGRAEDYQEQSECPQQVQAITGWWDLQPNKEYIHGGYVGWGYKEECWPLRNLIRLGSPTTTNVLDAADEMMAHEFYRPDGTMIKPLICGIDSGNNPDPAYSKARSMGILKCIPTKGTDSVGESIIKFPNTPNASNKTYLTTIGTVEAKDLIYERYRLQTPGPGYIHIPAANEEFDIDFYKGMVAEIKKVKNGKLQWCETAVRNEVLDWMVGNLALIRILQLPKYGLVLKPYVAENTTPLNASGSKRITTQDIASLWR